MAAVSPARRILARLEADVAQAFEGQSAVILAYSGGLASLVLAAIARKHGDLRCVVVGTKGAADAEAAKVAQFFLDYPVDVLRPTPDTLLGTARAMLRTAPRLSAADVLAILPLTLVEQANPGCPVLSGFGLVPRSPGVDRRLAATGSHAPGFRRAPSRAIVLRLARELGLPDAFALAAHRSPAEGSGIGPALRALGHARHASVARLLAVSD